MTMMFSYHETLYMMFPHLSPSNHQVLDSLKKHAGDPKPKAFPIHMQYIPAVMAAKQAEPCGDQPKDVGAGEESEGVAMKSTQKKSEPPKGAKVDSWQYSSLRNQFMQTKLCEGFTWNESKNLWDESLEKANFLSEISVPELKRRKFLPKGSQVNPWFEKVHGKPKL